MIWRSDLTFSMQAVFLTLFAIFIFSSHELVRGHSMICIENMLQATSRLLREQKLLQIRVHKHAA